MKKRHQKEIAFIVMFSLLLSIRLFGQNEISEPWEKEINERQPPEKVLKSIGVKPGMTIGEIGAGRGRYTVCLARETGKTGKVFANDIDAAALAYLRGRCRRSGIGNVETITGEMNDPLFPENSLDMAIMVLVYHMLDNPDELLRNLKHSLKPGARLVILDPHDEEIDREFGIDRSSAGSNSPTIKERIGKTAKATGYDLVKIETFLPHDYIFILKPVAQIKKQSAGELIQRRLLQDGIDSSLKEFNRIKNDSVHFDLSEKVFAILGYEFIGSRSYPEAITVLNMGIELFPQSSKLYGEIGEVYLLTGEKEKARSYYKLYLEKGPDSLNTKTLIQNFDAIYEQMHPHE